MKSVVIVFLAVFLGASVAVNFLEFKRYSTRRPIMLIADEPITVKDYEDQLDYKYGKQVLNKLAYTKLVKWAATKAGVAPTKSDVDARISQMDRHDPKLLAAARQDPGKMADIRQDIWTDIAFENVRMKGVTVSDAEVAAFYQKHKAAFALPAQVKTSIVVAENSVDAATAAELMRQNMSSDLIARQPRLHVVGVGGYMLPAQLPPALNARLSQTVSKMKVGDIQAVPAGNAFIVIRVTASIPATIPTLEEIRPFVTRLTKLSKAPSAATTMLALYGDAHVTFEVDKYAPFFDDIVQRETQLEEEKRSHPAKRLGS